MSAESDEIRRERKAQGYTQRSLAKASGVGLRSITRIETGEAERDGKDKDADTRSLVMLQKFLRVGPYKPETGQSNDPPLSQASFSELLHALSSKHGQDVRNAVALALAGRDTSRGPDRRPRESGTNGFVTPSFNAADFDNEQEADRATRTDETG